jgi:PAS domain S-box-containing protein
MGSGIYLRTDRYSEWHDDIHSSTAPTTYYTVTMVPLDALCVASAIAHDPSGEMIQHNEAFQNLVLLKDRTEPEGVMDGKMEKTDSGESIEDCDSSLTPTEGSSSLSEEVNEKYIDPTKGDTIWDILELKPGFFGKETKRIYQGDGQPNKWVSIHISTIDSGELGRTIFVQVEDVDESLRAKDQWTAILETSFDGFWDYHIQKDYEYMSPRFWEMFGYAPHEKEHSPSAWQNMIHPEDLKVALEHLGRHVASRGEHPYCLETRYLHKNGSWVWVLCRGRVIEWGDDGSPVRMVGTHTDITETKLKQIKERELHAKIEREHKRVVAANEELRRFVQHVNAPVFGVDNDGTINIWNLRMVEITRIAQESIVGKPLACSSVKNAAAMVQNALRQKEVTNSLLEIDIPSDGKSAAKSLSLLINTTTRKCVDGTVLGCFCFGLDLTEIQLANQKFVQERERFTAEKTLNEFVAHEVRNPLAAALSAAQFVRDTLIGANVPTELRASLRADTYVISTSLDHIHQLLTSMLDLNKFLAGGLTLSPRQVNLENDIVEPVYVMFAHRAEKSILSYEVPGDCYIEVDELRLKQILINLASNAIKFTQEGYVRIKAGRFDAGRHNMLHIYVEDSGPGIPAEKRWLLFQRYVQLSKQVQGSGIGLFLTRHLVEAMNGTIEIDTTYNSGIQEFPGTRFVVKIPLPDSKLVSPKCTPEKAIDDSSAMLKLSLASERPVDPSESLPVLSPAECFPPHMRVLVVDDDKIIRRILARRLQKLDKTMEIDQAESGEQAIAMIVPPDSKKYELVLVDHFMPLAGGELTGEETIAIIRSHVSGVIVGSSGNDMHKEHEAAGADLFWQKPVPRDSAIIEDLRRIFMAKTMIR